ncbi:MAG: glutathione transferase GstA [Burkholderiales bacterium]|nr:MAG: glutathione transferase GstA [Burkholderiales bacterium]
MKLYYSPAACSLAPHIALIEAGIKFDAVLASTKTHKLADGTDFYSINPLGYVPVLELDDGTRLMEGAAIVQYIADLAPEKKLAPANGTMDRYKLQSLLHFISTEIHKGFAPLFKPGMPEEAKQMAKDSLANRLKWVDGELAGKQFLMGDTFTVADGYLFNVTNWAAFVKVDISSFTNLLAFRERVAARPAVQQAMKAEGLIK